MSNNEPLLMPSNRLTIFPIEHYDMWEMYKKSVSVFWTPEELDLSKDVDDFNKLNNNEKFFIKQILAFFSSSDTIVNINLGERFLNDVQILEAKFFYGFQMAIENIHSETYSLLIDTYFKEPKEKDEALNAINYMPCIKKRLIGVSNGLMTKPPLFHKDYWHLLLLKGYFSVVLFVVFFGSKNAD